MWLLQGGYLQILVPLRTGQRQLPPVLVVVAAALSPSTTSPSASMRVLLPPPPDPPPVCGPPKLGQSITPKWGCSSWRQLLPSTTTTTTSRRNTIPLSWRIPLTPPLHSASASASFLSSQPRRASNPTTTSSEVGHVAAGEFSYGKTNNNTIKATT